MSESKYSTLACVNVFRAAGRGDCSNRGPSSFYHEVQFVYCANDEQIERITMGREREEILNDILQTPDLNPIAEKVFVAMQLTQGDRVYHYVVPLSMLLEGKQTMAGGNFIATTDSRFRDIAETMAVHDRVESR